MKYFRLLPAEGDRPEDIVCRREDGFENKYGITARTLFQGILFHEWDESFTFNYDPDEGDRFTDFLINDLQWILVSEKVRGILQDVGIDNIQFLRVQIQNIKSGSRTDGYSAINVTQLVDGLDLENSIYTELKSTGKPLLIVKKFALSSGKLQGKNIVRLANQPNPFFVSEIVVDALVQHGVTGCDFHEVSVI